MATATELGLTKPNKHGVLVPRTLSRAPVELFDRFVPTGTGPAKGQRYYRMLSGYAHAKSWAMVLGARQAAPLDGSRRTIAISQGHDRAAVGCIRLSVDTVERALDADELLRR
jgi:hypothetical protein